MHLLAAGSVMATALMLGALASAQTPAEKADSSEIVVTGTRSMEQQVRTFVRALTPAKPRGQLARFETSVCPAAWGLIPAQNEAVARRLRAVAAAADIDVGGKDCRPNAMVILVDDKKSFIEGLVKEQPSYFGPLSPVDVRKLALLPGPTASWQLVGKVDAGGMPIVSDGIDTPVNRTTEMQSRITASTRPVFNGAVLVIEKSALGGLTTTQLADYAAMRLLAKTDPSRATGLPAATILSVIDAPMGSEVPITLTQWDLAFLKGLYASPANLYARGQRSAISRSVEKDLREP